MRKVEGWLSDVGEFFETQEQAVASNLIWTVVNEMACRHDRVEVAKLIAAEYEIRRKDGA